MIEQNKNTTKAEKPNIIKRGATALLLAAGVTGIGVAGYAATQDSDPVKAPTTTTEAPTTSTTVAPETTSTTSTVPAPPELTPEGSAALEIHEDGTRVPVDPITGEPLPQDTIVTMEPSGFDIPGQAPGDPGVAGSATAIEKK